MKTSAIAMALACLGLLCAATSYAQTDYFVSGRVIDRDSGTPIAGAAIFLAGDPQRKPVFTDRGGRFSLNAKGAGAVRVVAIGYHQIEPVSFGAPQEKTLLIYAKRKKTKKEGNSNLRINSFLNRKLRVHQINSTNNSGFEERTRQCENYLAPCWERPLS